MLLLVGVLLYIQSETNFLPQLSGSDAGNITKDFAIIRCVGQYNNRRTYLPDAWTLCRIDQVMANLTSITLLHHLASPCFSSSLLIFSLHFLLLRFAWSGRIWAIFHDIIFFSSPSQVVLTDTSVPPVQLLSQNQSLDTHRYKDGPPSTAFCLLRCRVWNRWIHG